MNSEGLKVKYYSYEQYYVISLLVSSVWYNPFSLPNFSLATRQVLVQQATLHRGFGCGINFMTHIRKHAMSAIMSIAHIVSMCVTITCVRETFFSTSTVFTSEPGITRWILFAYWWWYARFWDKASSSATSTTTTIKSVAAAASCTILNLIRIIEIIGLPAGLGLERCNSSISKGQCICISKTTWHFFWDLCQEVDLHWWWENHWQYQWFHWTWCPVNVIKFANWQLPIPNAAPGRCLLCVCIVSSSRALLCVLSVRRSTFWDCAFCWRSLFPFQYGFTEEVWLFGSINSLYNKHRIRNFLLSAFQEPQWLFLFGL